MTRDEIIKMAREAQRENFDDGGHWFSMEAKDLERFAALVEQHLIASGYRKCAAGQRTTQFCGQLEQAVLAEREACIDINAMHGGSVEVEAAIRARGEK